MILPDTIKTIKAPFEFKLKEKASLFIALSFPIQSEIEAIDILAAIKKKYFDATHHCYSYKLQQGIFKYSDDGEPSGTAGLRIYNAQNHLELTNLLTIVVRYYGGTKLGVGPLGKAYYDSALSSLESINIITKTSYTKIDIEFDYSLSKTVHHFITKYKLIIQNSSYDPHPKMHCLIATAKIADFTKEVDTASNKKISLLILPQTEYL